MARKKKLTQTEKLQRQIERHDAKKIAKGVEQAPLFAEQIKAEVQAASLTPRELLWRKQRGITESLARHGAIAGDNLPILRGDYLLDTLTELRVRRLAANYLPAAILDALTDYRLRVYPRDASYGIGFWRRVLLGQRVEYAMHGEDVLPTPDMPFRFRRVVVDAFWPADGWISPFSPAELDALIAPHWEEKPNPAPFDTTPFDLRQWVLANRSQATPENLP